jgi:photosystem II stability/assembly factor-like uncharacterized protein
MTHKIKRLSIGIVALAACTGADSGQSASDRRLESTTQSSGTDALLQAISPVTDDVVWLSGHQASYARTLDGGRTWEASVVPGADALQFRDVAAFDAETAYLMSAGPGELSRIYRTDDGGASWRLQYTADDPAAFLDCMDFWSAERGLVYGDAVDGVPFLLQTEDGGATWSRIPAGSLPAALEGEGGFAASGSCLITGASGRAWVATGNGERARVLSTTDYGLSWDVVDVPVVGGATSGLTTIQMASDGSGVALGGVIGIDSIRSRNVAVTTDAGATWSEGGSLAMEGPVYGSALVDGADGVVVAVGPRGMDWSTDGGATWRSADTLTYWAVAFSSARAGWAVGPAGRIVKLVVSER